MIWIIFFCKKAFASSVDAMKLFLRISEFAIPSCAISKDFFLFVGSFRAFLRK